jgi:hypothetical protein
MKSKRSLMTVLVGIAMLATPITAAAHDHNYAHNNSHAAHVARSYNAPARSFAAPRDVVGPAVVRHELHNNAVPAVRDWRADRAWRDAHEYRNYGNPGYYPAPGYAVAGPGYGAPGYAGASSCRQAQSIMYNYYHDRNTGHPAAAAELLARNQWAFRSGCGGAAPAVGGLLGGLGRAPVYNGGYGQPYGAPSGLGPLIQQFVR